MRTAVSILGAGVLGLAGLLSRGEDQPSRLALPEIQINDNRRPAGQVREGVLYLRLEARMGTWRPEGLEAKGVEVTAFEVENGPLQNPGPVIRVPEGTEVQVSLRNLVPGKTLHVYGLHQRPDKTEQGVEVPTGTAREVRFATGLAGRTSTGHTDGEGTGCPGGDRESASGSTGRRCSGRPSGRPHLRAGALLGTGRPHGESSAG